MRNKYKNMKGYCTRKGNNHMRCIEKGCPYLKECRLKEETIKYKHKGGNKLMANKDGKGPRSGSQGPRDGRGGGSGRASGEGTGRKTGGKKGTC